MQTKLPKIVVITLGGTIASVPNDDGQGAVPKLSATDLLASVSNVGDLATLSTISFRQYPSGDLSIGDMIELSEVIEELAGNGAEGVVITQGTDTLEETAFLMDILLNVDIPVILTGAMRNAGQAGADGPANFLGAIRVACSPDARGLGPLVFFSDEIHLARFVRKVHSSSLSAFASPNAGPIGWVNEGRVRIPLVPRHRTPPVVLGDRPASTKPQVALIRVGLGMDSRQVDSAIQDGFDGLVIDSFGGGHVPQQMMPSLITAAREIPVVFATRTGAGEVYESTYGFPGSERDLLEHGLISAGVLDGAKSRLLLTLLLACGSSPGAIAQRFYQTVQ